MDRVVLTLLVLITAGAVTSLLLSRFFRKKWVWYFPSMIGVIFITNYSFKIQFENLEGFEELGYIILIYMVGAIMVGNLLTNVLIIRRRKITKKRLGDDEKNI